MSDVLSERPKLRPVEASPADGANDGMFVVRDPSGLGEGILTMSEPALFILSQLDGTRTLDDVRDAFHERYRQPLEGSTLVALVENLKSSRMLEGPEFDAYVESLVTQYRNAPVRESVYCRELGNTEAVTAYMSEMLPSQHDVAQENGLVVGLIAPHLDYPRGRPCYQEAYGALRGRPCPERCVILGTNHFGVSSSVTATGKAFDTPLGVTDVDVEFLEAVERRCGHDLRRHEFDHKREHSVELQLLCLQHLFGPRSFKIVPFLCPDPCGPTGTKPHDGRGVDLRDFADALAQVIEENGADTLLVAGADLSHVGHQFGDTFAVDASVLADVERRDRKVLSHLENCQPEAFIEELAREGNPTRVCSAGCIAIVAIGVRDASPTLHLYHQAFDQSAQLCVTCTAVTYVR